MIDHIELPAELENDLRRARRLEWASLVFMAGIIGLMAWAMGGSQAMRTAWVEDCLSLLPPAFFLLATWMERWRPTAKFPYGFHRAGSLAFFGAALVLVTFGLLLIWSAGASLVKMEHPTIGSMKLFGREIWLGWVMVVVLAVSAIPPVVLGRLKQKLADRLNDKVLVADADMNAADWQTALAGIVGVVGIGYGLWWADAIAALFISASILKDGVSNLQTALAELMDGAPRELRSQKISQHALNLEQEIKKRLPGSTVSMRETGRYIRAVAHLPSGQQAVLPPVDALTADWRVEGVGYSFESSGSEVPTAELGTKVARDRQ